MTPSHPLPSEPDLAALLDDIRTYTEQVRSMLMERFGSWAPDDPIMVALNTIEDAAANPHPDVGLRRLIVRAHRHLVMRGTPKEGEATYLALMDDLLEAVEGFAAPSPADPAPKGSVR